MQNGNDVMTDLPGEALPSQEWAPEYLAAIVDSSDDAIIGKTLDGTIISWNRGAERVYGYLASEIVGRPISVIIPPDRADELPRIMERLSHGESIDHYQTVRVRKDGRRIDVSVTVSPVRDSEGRVIGASAIARDITAQQETIREALQIRDEFISIAAHELRTPMSTVYARLQLAERRLGRPDGDREAILRDVKLAMEAAERMRKLVDRLLDISRLSSGRLELERAPTDVAATVRTVAGMFEELSARKIRVHVPRHADGARANVDALRVEQVVANLLDNASKYSPQEAPIEVDVTENRHAVCIAVRDHGDGVPEDQHEQIFEPFHRATNDKPGVGLGLHVAREIVRLHGGSLVLETPADGGARFVITLPKDGKPE